MSKMRDRYFKGYVKEKQLTGKRGKYKTSYVYHGNYYYWKAGPQVIAAHKKLFGVLLTVNILCMAMITLLNTGASRNVYVMAPVLMSVIPLIYEVIGVVQFCRTGDKVREFDFEEINLKLRYASLVNGALLIISAIMALVWLCLSEEKLSFALLCFMELVPAACSIVIYIKHKKLGTILTEEGDYGDIEDETYTHVEDEN